MQVLRKASLEEIKFHLLNLGGKNQKDNLQSIRHFPFYYLLRLSQNDFYGLVFLQRPDLHAMVPLGHDRRLRAVAGRTVTLGRTKLFDDWDLGEIRDRFDELKTEQAVPVLPALLLRDARPNEKQYGPWYLQDGSHRALAYAMAILETKASYVPQPAYLATTEQRVGKERTNAK